jgi:DNA-binding GntR family transcriptional regulator
MNETKSLADLAYTGIKEDILTCVLEPGSRIAQSQMVKRYEYGVTPVREALKRLEQEGYVQSIPRFGYWIAPIQIKDIEDIYDLRLILEKSAVRLAIQRATDQQVAHLEEQAHFTYTFHDRDSYLDFLDHNIRFHAAIAGMSGNQKLVEIITSLLGEMTRIFHLGLDLRDSAEEMQGEHLALSAAIAARNITRAEELVYDQITRSRQRVLEMLSRREQGSSTPYSWMGGQTK